MDRSEALTLLPPVGAARMEVPSEWGGDKEERHPVHCVVVMVCQRHLWYMVKFDCGVRECYKVPKVKHWTEVPPVSQRTANHKIKRPRKKKT